MKVSYFDDTDTLYVEFRTDAVVETRELDEDTLLDLDADGALCALTIEHASSRTDLESFRVEGIAA